MKEIWKDIKGYEGLYQVSNLGNVKSLIKNKILKNSINQNGYVFMALYKNNNIKRYRLHRLVAEAFIPNPLNKRCVNHKNGIKNDNNVNNLEWCTNSENTIHAYNNGLRKKYYGKDNKKSIPILQYDLNNNFIKEWDNQLIASNELKVNRANIYDVLKGKRKSAGGYIWKYKEGATND